MERNEHAGRAQRQGKVDLVEKVTAIVRPIVEDAGYELVEVRCTGAGRRAFVRVTIDKPLGVTVDDCAAVSRSLSDALETEDPIPGRYTLEVSSPGVDRPLWTPEQFQGHIGRLVRAKTSRPVAGRTDHLGRLVEVHSGRIVLDGEEGRKEIPIDCIAEAHREVEF